MDLSAVEQGASGLAPPGRTLTSATPWEAYLLEVSTFPISEPERAATLRFLCMLVDILERKHGLRTVVFLQANQLYLENGERTLQRMARAWLPELGVGIFPDRGPMQPWTREEFEELEPGDEMRPVIHQIFRVHAVGSGLHDAWQSMFGGGTVLLMLTTDSESQLVDKANQLLRPLAENPAFPSFSLHAPLLDSKSIAGPNAANLDDWTCGASCYVRESKEDGGVLFLLRKPLQDLLKAIQDLPTGLAVVPLLASDAG
jgi:hypothetical protein